MRHLIALLLALAVACGVLAQADEKPATKTTRKLIYIGASWCGPCRATPPINAALRRQGVELLEYDADAANVSRLFGSRTLPCWLDLGAAPRLEGLPAGDAGEAAATILQRLGETPTGTPATSQPPDLVALVRQYVGDHASLELTIPHGREIDLGGTLLKLPELTRLDLEVNADAVLVTFEKPLPQAHKSLTVGSVTADIPSLTIRGHVITAAAELGLGISKRFTFEVKELPWD